MDDDDLIPLSALQHYLYCPRQCALIHLEQQWADNRQTAEGHTSAWIETSPSRLPRRHSRVALTRARGLKLVMPRRRADQRRSRSHEPTS